jgi:isopenicillin N synthase-like dioxygenase
MKVRGGMPLPESRQLDFDEIPVIDISRIHDRDGAAEITCAIDRACEDIGFFYIVGHGLNRHLISQLVAASSEFFKMLESTKLKLGLDPSMPGYQEGKWRGFFPVDDTRED